MRKILKLVGFLSLSLFVGVPAKSADFPYTVIDMGAFSPQAINAQGDVVGTITSSNGEQEAVLFTGGELGHLIHLGTLGQQSSYATGINDAGQIVGTVYTQNGQRRAFIYENEQMTDLNELLDSGSGPILNEARAINKHGLIAGLCSTSTESEHVFVYDYANHAINDLGVLGSENSVNGINEQGRIIGGYNYVFVRGYTFFDRTFTDLGTVDGIFASTAMGINARGQIVGYQTVQGEIFLEEHAYLYEEGTMYDINPPGCRTAANGINDQGQIVGFSDAFHAFLYEDGEMTDLNTLIDPDLGITLFEAKGINNAGQIIVAGFDDIGGHAYLLTPIPEPSMLMLLAIGFCGIIASRLYGVRRGKHRK